MPSIEELIKLAEKNDSEAVRGLGMIAESCGDTLAIETLRVLAMDGNEEAFEIIVHLAEMNRFTAIETLSRMASKGHVRASEELKRMLPTHPSACWLDRPEYKAQN